MKLTSIFGALVLAAFGSSAIAADPPAVKLKSIVIPGNAPGSFLLGNGAVPDHVFHVRNNVTSSAVSFAFVETDPFATGGTFHYSLHVKNIMSGSGHRQVLTPELVSSAANVNDMLAAETGICEITGGSGNCFGGNPYAWAAPGAATTAQIVGEEANTKVENASVVKKVGIQIVDVAGSTGSGTVDDSGILIGKHETAVGYKNGITFGVNGTTGFGIHDKLMYAKISSQSLTAIMDFGGLTGTIGNGIILPVGSDLSFGTGSNPNGGMVKSLTAANGPRIIFGDGLVRINNNANTTMLLDVNSSGVTLPTGAIIGFGSGSTPAGGAVVSATAANGPRIIFGDNLVRINNNANTVALLDVAGTGIEAKKDVTITSGSKTGNSEPALKVTQTWNNAATAFTAANIDITDTASSAFSRLQSWQVGGVDKAYVRKDGWIYASTGYNVTNNAGSYILGASSDAILSRRAAANWRLGAADAAAPVAQTLSVQSVVSGTTDTAGADWTFTGSQGTGTGAGGKIKFRVAPPGGTGSAQNALADALTINADKSVVFASNITIGDAAALIKSSVAMNNGAAAQTGTLTNAPAAGNPTKWIPINDNGTTRYIPAW